MELKETNKYCKALCLCCGYYTISQVAETCPVCYWEENIYQEEYIEDNDAPNYVSLKEARENFQIYEAKKPEYKNLTRKPFPEEFER